MSESDSFLDEVNEEVRRDRLLNFVKKNAVFVVGALVLVVGGSGFNEYLKARAEAAAQSRGDAMIAALELEDTAARVTAFDALLPEAENSAPLVRFQLAAAHELNGDKAAAIATLTEIATDVDLTDAYKDTARLKIAILAEGQIEPEERDTILEQLSVPGHPLRALAREQTALLHLSAGETDAAIEVFQDIYGADDTLPGVRERTGQMLTVLGIDPTAEPDLDAVDG